MTDRMLVLVYTITAWYQRVNCVCYHHRKAEPTNTFNQAGT